MISVSYSYTEAPLLQKLAKEERMSEKQIFFSKKFDIDLFWPSFHGHLGFFSYQKKGSTFDIILICCIRVYVIWSLAAHDVTDVD